MILLESQNRIRELMSFFVTQVKLAGERIDINLASENILIPLLGEIYEYSNLKNLNETEGRNYPGIDLGDKVAKVAIQVTATANNEKIKDTLRKFVEYRLYEQYDRLIIYILTEKQQSYSGKGYQEIIEDRFTFDKDTDILDANDVIKAVNRLQIDRIRQIEQFLEANFGDGTTPWYPRPELIESETINLNLLELFFPKEIYVADIDIDREKVVRHSKRRRVEVSRHSSTKDIVRAALEQQGRGFGVDWVCHEGKIVTFHDLTDSSLPLSLVVDKGTITLLNSDEFYEIDRNYAKVFTHLLRRCMQQKLYHQGVVWQQEDRLFIFVGEENREKRIEEWYDKRTSRRTVYERTMRTNEPNKVWYCKHQAFRMEFRRFDTRWYVLIKPEWFFSYDGYKKSFYDSEKVEWLKRKEINMHVYNHVRFIVHFLKYGRPSTLFTQRPEYPFLEFGELLSFESDVVLNDDDWLPGEPEGKFESSLPLFEEL